MPVHDPAARGQLGGLTKQANAAVQRLIAARIEQGLPPMVTDPVALHAILALLGLVQGKEAA